MDCAPHSIFNAVGRAGLTAALARDTRPKDRRADPHMCCPQRDGRGEIAAHSHGQARQSVARRKFGKQGEMQCRFFVHWRDAHQASNRKIQRATFRNEIIGLRWKHPGFLSFLAGVDLNEQFRALPDFLCKAGKRFGKFWSIDGVNGLK
jgi:hypothetical protein